MKQLRYLKHDQIDLTKWDKTVNASQFRSIFANTFFLNATSPEWDALVIGDYESVFPLTVKRKYGYRYLPQPMFTGQLGLFGKVNTEIETEIYNYLRAHFKLIEIELNSSQQLKAEGINLKKTFTIDYKTQWTYNQNTKRNIKKAIASGLKVEEVPKKEIQLLSKKHLNPFLKGELGIDKAGLDCLSRLLEDAMKKNAMITYRVVDNKGKIRALAHFIYNKHHALYLKGTNMDKKENSGSMHLLMDKAIQDFKQKSSLFDFGGGTKPGIANFFKGLGGQALPYPTIKINKLPLIVQMLKNKR